MDCLRVLLATVFATSAMTSFSYLLSESFRKLYKEPVLLQYLMTVFKLELSITGKKIASWLLHYFIGLLFVVLYQAPLWLDILSYRPTINTGLLFGGIIGCVGILGWEIMFRIAAANPPVKKSGYYIQLFVAHVIFGITTVGVFYLMDRLD